VNSFESEACLKAERMFLKTLQGGCSIPVFGYAQLFGKEVTMDGGIISLDGKKIIKLKEKGTIEEVEKIGRRLALKVLETGGAEILAEIKNRLPGY
jgi:hydroxymethylbilane synthase